MKRFSAFLLAVIFSLQIIPLAFAKKAQTKDEPKYYVSFEGLTLGQGMYVEPTYYTLSEVQELMPDAEITEDSLTAALLTMACLKDKGLEFQYTGDYTTFYLSCIKDIDKGYIDLPQVIVENTGYTNDTTDGNSDEWLGEFDYTSMSGWMITVNDFMITAGAGQWHVESDGYVRCCFTFYGWGADLGHDSGWGNEPYFVHANKDGLNKLYADINRKNAGFFESNPTVKESVLSVMENLTATEAEVERAYTELKTAYENQDVSREARDLTEQIHDASKALAETVTEPAFGTLGGEWSVLCLARGGYYKTDSEYFENYYNRIVDTVNETCASVNMNGALHKVKSTENSRLILALSAIGKDARSVGDWNLITPYENFSWITKQGINGPVYALIALDTLNYQTEDTTIRQQCVDYILSKECPDGGFALSGTTADPDMTAMTIQGLAPYAKTDENVKAVIDRAFNALSALQQNDGGFASWGSVNSESCAQVVAACATMGINPDTDPRFVKENGSVVDALMSFYLEDSHTFAHVGTTSNAMATDQGLYAMIAYQRMMDGKTTLYDMSDVQVVSYDENGFMKINAILTAPAIVSNSKGTAFKAKVALSGWDSDKEYKLLDAVMTVPQGIKVVDVKASENISGGIMYWQQEEATGKLRIAYSDLNGYGNINAASDIYPVEIFTVELELNDKLSTNKAELAVTGMSLKLGADSQDKAMMHIINTANAISEITFKNERAVFAYTLFGGDGVDLIEEDMQAVAVLVTETDNNTKAYFGDKELLYNAQLSEQTGVTTYVAMMSTSDTLDELNKISNYSFEENSAPASMSFGDVNNDGVMNAQDALNTVNAWLRKGDKPTSNTILAMNVNCDSRINTFDALGIADSFVNGTELIIVKYGATLSAK